MNRSWKHVAYINTAVFFAFFFWPFLTINALTDNVINHTVFAAVYSNGSNHFSVFFHKIILRTVLSIQPHPGIPAGISHIISAVMQFYRHFILIDSILIWYNNNIVAVFTYRSWILGIVYPCCSTQNVLVLINTGFQINGTGKYTIFIFCQWICSRTPAIHRTCKCHFCRSTVLIPEGYLGSIYLWTYDYVWQIRSSGQDRTNIFSFLIRCIRNYP